MQYSEICQSRVQDCSLMWDYLRKSYKVLYESIDKIPKSVHQSMIVRLYAYIVAKGIFYKNVITHSSLTSIIGTWRPQLGNFNLEARIQTKKTLSKSLQCRALQTS